MSGPEEGENSATDTNVLRLVCNMSVSYTLRSYCFFSRILYPVSCLAHLSGYSRVSRSGQVPTKNCYGFGLVYWGGFPFV